MSSLTTLPAVDIVRLLREKKVTPLEVAEEHISAIERLNPLLNAFIDFDPDRVREQARKIVVGSGALAGLPISIKSSISTAGHRCEVGSPIYRGNVPDADAVAVRRLRDAGALVLGTTNCPELLMAYETENLLYGRTNNPWNLDYSAGGSSGGESAAIAAGLSAGGLGSDSGGSVRQPAHATGICSLKPTPSCIPPTGHVPSCVGPFSFLGAIGPMARTMADVQMLFQVVKGRDTLDPHGAPLTETGVSEAEIRGVSIAYFEDDGLVPVTQETRRAVKNAATALQSAGFRVTPYRPACLEEARQLWWMFFVRCGAAFVRSMLKEASVTKISGTLQDFLTIADRESEVDGIELLNAWAGSDVVRSKLLSEFQNFPIWLCPVSSIPAFRHGERAWKVDDCHVSYLDAMRHTQWFNLIGAPAAVVPVSQSSEGLPIGVQIAGAPYSDELVLRIAAILDREFGYQAPPMAASRGELLTRIQ